MEESGDLNLLIRRLGIAYELFTIANSYVEESVDIMTRYDIVHKKLKTAANNLMQSFDVFDARMKALINTPSTTEHFRIDVETLEEIISTFMSSDVTIKRGAYVSPTLFLPEKPIKK